MAELTPSSLVERVNEERKSGPVHFRFDFDGTVAQFNPFPLDSRPDPVAFEAYSTLAEQPGVTVGVITGRYLDFLDPLFPEEFSLSCSYGLEGRSGTERWRHPELQKWEAPIAMFRSRAEAAINAVGGRFSESAPQAQQIDGVYIEIKTAGITLQEGPALTGNPNSNVAEVIAAAIETLRNDYNGLNRHENNGNVEFAAAMFNKDGSPIDKGSVIDDLDGFVVFSAVDTDDLPAARQVRARGGFVLAVNHLEDGIRRGTPAELLDYADAIFGSVEEHGLFMNEVSRELARSLQFEPVAQIAIPKAPNNKTFGLE